jgi:hypothetical protein
MRGLEPPRNCFHSVLSAARLPVPPHPQNEAEYYWINRKKAKGKNQKAKGKSEESEQEVLEILHFCLLPFAFCLLIFSSAGPPPTMLASSNKSV